MTVSPGFLLQGIDSPVSIDSSMDVVPLTISPSEGIFAPGTTLRISPF